MDHHGLGHHHPAQDDLPALIHRLDLRLRDLWRIIAVERVFRDHHGILRRRFPVIRRQDGRLNGCGLGQDLCAGDGQRLVALRLHQQVILRVGLNDTGLQAVFHRRRGQRHLFRLP